MNNVLWFLIGVVATSVVLVGIVNVNGYLEKRITSRLKFTEKKLEYLKSDNKSLQSRIEELESDLHGNIMSLRRYQYLAARTINESLTDQDKMIHGALGLASEAGEVTGLYQKKYQGHVFNREELVKELGDCMWMLAEIATANDILLDEVGQRNIEKLMKRYPEGFSEQKSINRDESKE